MAKKREHRADKRRGIYFPIRGRLKLIDVIAMNRQAFAFKDSVAMPVRVVPEADYRRLLAAAKRKGRA